MYIEEHIEHFGVKGQRWGVTRAKVKSAGESANKSVRNARVAKSPLSKTAFSKDEQIKAKRAKASATRRLLDDKDLDAYISRLDREKKLKSLTEADVTPGKAFAKSVASNAGRTAATAVLTGAVMYGVRAALQKKFDPMEAAAYLKPKK